MSLELPSLRAFQPKFYSGGPSRHYLALFYDLVALEKPATILTLGLGDAQAHLTFCQAVKENALPAKCVAVPLHGDRAEHEHEARELYGEISEFGDAAAGRLEQIDLLLIDDCDSGAEIRALVEQWAPKLSARGVVLVHGIALDRADSPAAAWRQWNGDRASAEFLDGIGLGVSNASAPVFQVQGLAEIYRLVAERIAARHEADELARENARLEAQHVWLDSLAADRMEAQRVMDHQDRELRQLREVQTQLLSRDGGKHPLAAENSKLKAKIEEQKQFMALAKRACRKNGNCFRLGESNGADQRKTVGARLVRELQRLPRNLRNLVRPAAPIAAPEKRGKDRYAKWITTYEATAERPRFAPGEWQPKISLVVPVLDPPAEFLEAMLKSVFDQTYDNWELCIVDAGSKKPTAARLKSAQEGDGRVKLERLAQNLGIAENTNRAFALATGDFITCIDHDDVLAPFAMAEAAAAILQNPEAEILYSDEDRLSSEGKRHSPFFKPEWSPELLLSSMYLGHLTFYRRALVQELGGWRREYDLSQDYDFALRATDQPRTIVHIAHVLYHWREHPASGSAGGKPEARKTNLAALADAMRRRNLPAEIVEYPASNRARLTFSRTPRVSIIIPTDSLLRARRCLEGLPAATNYPDYELLIVTNSAVAERLESSMSGDAPARCVRFDEPFNFSKKCNAGAAAATGERLVFFNDDVATQQADWIQNLIEPLENPEIGAVSPKLLYDNGTIQHAGLVTGVRGLVGTAFHKEAADSGVHWNLAQQMRDVSALSGACLAIRRDDFVRLGGWDEVNTPIAHSDLDLCFKIREAGMRCVYTPFATLRHTGHQSIGEVELAAKQSATRDKSSVYLLRRWGGYTTHDPYFPPTMRDWLYADSPTPIQMSGRNQPVTTRGRGDLLFVSPDLSWSGAPLILLQIAEWCTAHGFFVTVSSPKDGPLRQKFADAGVPVIVDALSEKGDEAFVALARQFDCVVASTIFSAAAVRCAKRAGIPHLWWIHEGHVAAEYVSSDPVLREALASADHIVTPDSRSAQLYRPFATRAVRILPYGIREPAVKAAASKSDERIEFLLLGTIEQRKGQQVLLQALRLLPDDILKHVHFNVVGRAHEPLIASELAVAAESWPWLTYREVAVSSEEALGLIAATDVMISASWDETGPLVLMEAAAMRKALLSTNVGAVSECLRDGEEAIFFRPAAAQELATAIERLVREPELVRRLGARAREGYERCFTFERFASDFAEIVGGVIAR